MDAQGDKGLEDLQTLLSDLADDPQQIQRARGLTLGAWAGRQRYDAWIQQASEHWDLARISSVERNILRLAIYELMDCGEPPAKVAINEAIELAKAFGASASAKFVNGVLDSVWRAHAEESVKDTP